MQQSNTRDLIAENEKLIERLYACAERTKFLLGIGYTTYQPNLDQEETATRISSN